MIFSFNKEQLTEKDQRKDLIKTILKRVFINDWHLKLTALFISFSLWLGVTGFRDLTTTRLRNVTLNPLVANDLEITNANQVEEVDLVVSGDKRVVEQLSSRDLVVSVDFANIQEGERSLQITPQNVTVDLPNGIKILEIQPNKIALKLEKLIEAVVTIRAETDGRIANGYEIYSRKVTPEKVRVRGPKSIIESLKYVATEKIKLEKRKTDYVSTQIPLNITNPKVSMVDVVAANVDIRIGKKRIERLFVKPYETESRIGRASILLYGPDFILENLTVDDMEIVEQINEDGNIKLRLILPDEVDDDVQIKSVKYRE